MWPPSTLPVLKVVPPEGDTFNGKFIPGKLNFLELFPFLERSQGFVPHLEVLLPNHVQQLLSSLSREDN